MRKNRLALAAVTLIASCAPALAWVGQTPHDWSVVLPATEIRFGIVEWQTATSTVFLGPLDFRLPCGAATSTCLLLFSVAIIGTGALFLSRRRKHEVAA